MYLSHANKIQGLKGVHMSNMLSKEVRTYWKEKVSSKFSDRTNDIETENHNKITAISNAKYPAFEKSLGLAKLIKALKSCRKVI